MYFDCNCLFCGFRCVSCAYWLYILFRSISQIRFIDNTDPAGIDHQIAQLGPELASTLVIVISKVHIIPNFPYSLPLFTPAINYLFALHVCLYLQSGGTPETRNGLLEVQKAFRDAGLEFSKQVLTSGSFIFLMFFIY